MSSPTPRTQGLKSPTLSASHAEEYERRPYQYRLHVVDKISDPPNKATMLGILVHSVLEHLYGPPSKECSVEAATGLLEEEWDARKVSPPEALSVFGTPEEEGPWFESARKTVTVYFSIEDPQWLVPVAREQLVDAVTADGICLRGFIDRIDRSTAEDPRVVDYEAGHAPSPRFQDEMLFQVCFYTLLLQLTDRLPTRAQLLYSKSGQVLIPDPDSGGIARFSDQISELWGRIEVDARREEFMPHRNPLCNWCGVKHLHSLFKGRAPEPPKKGFERLLRTRML